MMICSVSILLLKSGLIEFCKDGCIAAGFWRSGNIGSSRVIRKWVCFLQKNPNFSLLICNVNSSCSCTCVLTNTSAIQYTSIRYFRFLTGHCKKTSVDVFFSLEHPMMCCTLFQCCRAFHEVRLWCLVLELYLLHVQIAVQTQSGLDRIGVPWLRRVGIRCFMETCDYWMLSPDSFTTCEDLIMQKCDCNGCVRIRGREIRRNPL